MITPTEVTKEIKKYDKDVQKVEAYATTLAIVDEDSYKAALEEGKKIKDVLEAVKAKEDEIVKPLKAVIKTTQDLFKPHKTKLETALDTIRGKMTTYYKEKERKELEEKAKIAKALEDGKIKKIETAVRKTAEVEHVEKTVTTDTAKVTMAKKYVYEVEELTKVPYEFLEVNMVKVKAWEKLHGKLPEGIKKTEDISMRIM